MLPGRRRQGSTPRAGKPGGEHNGRRAADMTPNRSVATWVEECARLCQPERITWCDGSEEERARLIQEALASGDLHALNPQKLAGSYLHRSAENDVARTENLTFICCPDRDDA